MIIATAAAAAGQLIIQFTAKRARGARASARLISARLREQTARADCGDEIELPMHLCELHGRADARGNRR